MKKIIVTVITAVMCVFTMTACGTTKIDPESYCSVEVNGANGYAEAKLTPDYEALMLVLSSKSESVEDKLVSALYADLIKFEIASDKKENLENGDVIKVNVNYNEDALKQIGFSVKKDSFTYKVEGLEEVKEIDAFKDIVVNYTGYSPKAKIELDTSNCEDIVRNVISFEYDKDLRVANGDTFTIKAVCANNEALLKAGYILENDTHQVTVADVEEGKQIDTFEDLKIEYIGISPYVTIETDNYECDDIVKDNISFVCDKEFYANGEKVKLIAEFDEEALNSKGIVVANSVKELDIADMPYYIESDEGIEFSEINNELKDQLEATLADKEFIKGADKNGNSVLYDSDSWDTWNINEINVTPVKKLFFNAKQEDTKVSNKYTVVWEIDLEIEKVKKWTAGYASDDYGIGDKLQLKYYATSQINNVAVNSDKTFNTDTSKINVELYILSYHGKADKDTTTETIIESCRANNIDEYTVTISDYE